MAERAHPEDAGFKDKWFGLKRNVYKRKLFERYRFCNALISGRRVLDVPCGTGWGTSLLKGYSFLRGVDNDGAAVAYAEQHYGRPGKLEFAVGDMRSLPGADGEYGVVVCLEGFEHVARDVGHAFLAEVRRVLEPGGLLVMTCPVLNEYGEDTGNPYHLCEYPEQELIELLNSQFRVQRIERIAGPEGPEYRCIVSHYGRTRYLAR